MTLKEYLEDYASSDTKIKGEAVINDELRHITNEKVRNTAIKNLGDIERGKRDFRF